MLFWGKTLKFIQRRGFWEDGRVENIRNISFHVDNSCMGRIYLINRFEFQYIEGFQFPEKDLGGKL